MREKKTSLRFAGRKHSGKGLSSAVIGGIAWGICIALCICSSTTNGNAELVVGVIGILDAVFALAGVLLAVRGFQEREVYYVFPTIGIVANGSLFVLYFILYIMGVAVR